MAQPLRSFLSAPVPSAPLTVFRILFGMMMLGSIVRFVAKGWVYDLYVAPKHFFPFYGFEWVKPLGETCMYFLFGVMALAALGITLGLFYRWSAVMFFLSFTYVELIDKTNYLNHYYFVSVVAFLLILVPAHRHFSLDVLKKPSLLLAQVPRWTILIFQVQLALVYLFAGIAKLNPDWLLEAMPLRYWLPAHTHLPLIGPILDYLWVAYVFCWFGAFYDLTIPFFLTWHKTRPMAYATVVVFHVLTAVLFQIGMFPYIMMLSTLIFFPASFHEKILQAVRTIFKIKVAPAITNKALPKPISGFLVGVLALHFLLQITLPFRFMLYPGNLFWTEQGYRFSWRVMLMEKSGTAFFYVKDPQTGHETEIHNRDYLTLNQEKMVATQPDMLLQYAHLLRDSFKAKGIQNPEVRAETYVTMNGRGSRLLIDPQFNLAAAQDNFWHKHWILPFEENVPTLNR